MPYVVEVKRPKTADEIKEAFAGVYWTCGSCHATFSRDTDENYCDDCNQRLRRNDDVRIALADAPMLVLYRRAVATIEEVQDACRDQIYSEDGQRRIQDSHTHWDSVFAISELSDSGGSVGPLPDGRTITVQATTWRRIYHDLDGEWPERYAGWEPEWDDHDEALAAWNERNGITEGGPA